MSALRYDAHPHQRCDACSDIIADLKAEIADLRTELGLAVTDDQITALRKRLGLSPNEAWALFALNQSGRVMRFEQLLAHMPARGDPLDRGLDQVKTVISKVRHRVGPEVIETVWGVGYRITDAGREKVAEALR
jgi:DNA-binding response OmpR family regulator